MPSPSNKKELKVFLGIINYLGKFSPDTAGVCKPLRKLTLCKSSWTWNESYQQIYNKAKSIIKKGMCMKFYNEKKEFFLEKDASGVGLRAALLQLRDNTAWQQGTAPDNTILWPIAFASKSLKGAKSRYSNIEHEALGIIHGLEKFHHYCFGRNVIVITDHKPLVAIFKKDVATLSQQIQCIILKIQQYHVQIIHKSGPQIFIADWLSRQDHKEGKDMQIQDMDIWVDAIQAMTDLPKCISIPEMQHHCKTIIYNYFKVI